LGFGGGNGIAWLFTCGLVLLFAESIRHPGQAASALGTRGQLLIR
jgi:hypothetical protein